MVGSRPRGGGFALAQLIDQHGNALLAEFQARYGLRLGEVVQQRYPDEVLALIEWLPDHGPFAASIRGGRQFLGWGQLQSSVADLWDLVAAVGYKALGVKKKPPRYPRPDAPEQTKPTWRMLMNQMRRVQGRG